MPSLLSKAYCKAEYLDDLKSVKSVSSISHQRWYYNLCWHERNLKLFFTGLLWEIHWSHVVSPQKWTNNAEIGSSSLRDQAKFRYTEWLLDRHFDKFRSINKNNVDTMGLLPDAYNYGLRRRRECRERFPRHRRLVIPICITVQAVRNVSWCMPGSPTRGFLWRRWRGKRSRHPRCIRNPQFYVSGKRTI